MSETEAANEAAYKTCQKWIAEGHLDQGIAGLERLVSQAPDFARAHNDLGVLYYQQGDKAQCLRCYEKAFKIDSCNPVFQKNLADFYLVEAGRVEKALAIYTAVLEENPEDIDALMVAGHIYTMLDDVESATLFYERILDIEPWNTDALERIEMFESR